MSRVALLQAEKGPPVFIERIARPALEITGLPEGAKVTLHTFNIAGKVQEVQTFSSNGVFPFQPATWAQVNCDYAKKHCTIATVVNHKAA